MKKQLFQIVLSGILVVLPSSVYAQDSNFAGGKGTAAEPYLIKTAEHLDHLRTYASPDYKDHHYSLMNDIDLTEFLAGKEEGWLPIGYPSDVFLGHFHGNGYKIMNLFIHRPEEDNIGFFRDIASEATIDNLGLEIAAGDSILGGDYVGGLVGFMHQSAVSSCYVSGKVVGSYMVGGLVGQQAKDGTIDYCHTMGEVTGYDWGKDIGGLVGNAGGIINNSYSSSIVNSKETAGGLIGSNSAVVSACYATGNVTASYIASIGGLIGYNAGDVRFCYSTGNVPGTDVDWVGVSFGGLIGGNNGTVGNGIVSDCYATGNVFQSKVGAGDPGGLAASNTGIIQNSYATGQIGAAHTGPYETVRKGLAGSSDLENMIDCHFDKQTTGVDYGLIIDETYLIPGNTTAEMMQQSTYENWDFETVWDIQEGETYPFFRWETERKSLLKSITLDAGTLSPVFSPGVFEYTLHLPAGTNKIDLSALAVDGATLTGDMGELTLPEGETIFVLTVNAENTPEHIYRITVTREATSITEIILPDIEIYPNPTSDIVNLLQETAVKVYNQQGALLQETFGKQIDLSAYPQGVYLLQIGGQLVKVLKE